MGLPQARRGKLCRYVASPGQVAPGLQRAQRRPGLAAGVLVSVVALSVSATGPALVGAYRRYHSYQDLGPGSQQPYYGSASRSQGVFLPPIAWLFQDYEETFAACPFLIGLCMAASGSFVLQHGFGRCFPFYQRIAVFYPPTLKAGELWRLLTHALLHSDLGHIAVNLLHILNTLDLEAVLPGTGYPSCYCMGTTHVVGAAATATVFAALVASVPYFGAMFEGASALCFGLDGALLTATGLLLGAGVDPSIRGFLQVRGCYAAFHMGIDVLRGCTRPGGTVGNFAHLAGFVGGACYVLAVLPALGGRPAPIVPCLAKGRGGTWNWEEECLAFFSNRHSAPVQQVQSAAQAVLMLGIGGALLNAFVVRRHVHASADGYSVLVKAPGQRHAGGRAAGRGDADFEAALARSMESYTEEVQRRTG